MTLQHLPVLLASSARSGPSHLHNCACMTLILPGFKMGNIPPTLDWDLTLLFFPEQLTQVVSLTNPTENGVFTVKSFLTSAVAAHMAPLKYYFMLTA